MSMETHVFFRGRLPSKAALSRAMKELGFPFSIKPATGSLEAQRGFMPMLLRREETGVEFDAYDGRSAVEEFADVGVDRVFDRRASCRWGGDFQEAVAGTCVAAALARLVDGVVFDEAENRLLSVDDAIAVAKMNLKELPEPPKRRLPRGPRVTERILAPLLAKRGDLVLIGRLLLIRPVRHLIRGAEFRWHHRGTACSVAPYIRPLYQPSELFLEDAVFSASVDNPDFTPMLFDRLAVDVFERLGKIATIEDFIESSWGKRLWPVAMLPSILVSRGIAQAKSYLAPFDAKLEGMLTEAKTRLALTDRGNATAMCHRTSEAKAAKQAIVSAKGREAFLARGDAAVFAHYRKWETEVARGMKLEHVWDPSPFPVELPAAQRTAKSADPTFPPMPWLEFPGTWRQDPPEAPGEVRFARNWWHRDGQVTLLHPITREQAEERHRNLDGYVLATRLPKEQLVILIFEGSPKEEQSMFLTTYTLWIYDSQRRYMIADFRADREDPAMLKMTILDIRKIEGHYGCWQSYLDFDANEKAIHDHRAEETRYERCKMTDAERAAYAFPLPNFGEFPILWERISMHLEAEGFGAFE